MRLGIGIGLARRKSAASGGGGFDPDAQAFFDRVTTAGGTLTTTEKNATNQLVLDMKSAGIWTAMKAVYPMVGASAAACAQNLKSSSFTGTFTSGWTFASTGVTPNGVSAFMDTSLVPNTEFATANDGNFGYYVRTDLVSAKVVLGCNSGPWVIDFPFTGGTFYPSINDGNSSTISPGYSKGMRQLSRNSTLLNQLLYLQNTTPYTRIEAATTKVTTPVKLGSSTSQYFSSNEIAFAYIGNGQLSVINQTNYYTAVQAFQTTLSRQV